MMKKFLVTTNRQLFPLFVSAAILSSLANATEKKAEVIASFEKPDSTKNWQSVNDGVMGGLSKGSFERSERQTLLFTGDLSLKNSGGFASIRTTPNAMNLDGASGIIVKARGDGRTYRVQLRTDNRMATSYRTNLPTTKGGFQEYLIPFSDFKLQSFGRMVPRSKPVDPSEIKGIGISIADKKAGPFEFELESIKVVRGEIKPPGQDLSEEAIEDDQIGLVTQPIQKAGTIENALALVTYQKPLPAKLARMAMVEGPARMLNASPTMPPKIDITEAGVVYLQQDDKMTVFDAKGNEQLSFQIPPEVKFYLGITVLPDGRIAFFDNRLDAIYFVSQEGEHLKTVTINAKPDQRLQGMRGIVVDDQLIVSENGENQLLSVDLGTYQVSLFRDFEKIKGWLGAIAYADGVYYLCQGRVIHSFAADSNEVTKLATTPKGNIRRAIVVDGKLRVAVIVPQKSNEGGLFEVDLKSGKLSEVANALNTPEGLILLKTKGGKTVAE